MPGRIAAIVVTHDRKELLLECLDALMRQSAGNQADIVVVDNDSSDGTAEAVRELVDENKVKYLNTGSNLGGAGGFNYGMRYAAENGYEYVWVMDDDCIPDERALEVFLEFDSRHSGEYGFLSSAVIWKDGTPCRMNIQRETLTTCVKDFSRKEIRITMASFVSLFMPCRLLYTIGLPIKEFFIWTDDWEFTRRISRLYPAYLLTESRVLHKSASNRGASIADAPANRLDRFRYLYRNDVYLYRREGLKGFCYEAVRLIWHSVRIIARSDDRKARLLTVWKNTAEGLKFRPEIEFPERSIE